jgi:hypothetical protein
MKSPLLAILFGLATVAAFAEMPAVLPPKVSTTSDFRQLLLATKWSWRNVSANVPDRECVFMADGTFRHPHFVAKFTIKDINTVELTKLNDSGTGTKGSGKDSKDAKKPKGAETAILTFDPTYMSFEAIDFDKARRTGRRIP